MAERARVLFLSQCLPYPPHSGVRARTFSILKQLQVDFDVTLLAFSRRSHQGDERARREAERVLADLLYHVGPAITIRGERSRVEQVWDHLRSLITRRPYTFYVYDSRRFRSELGGLLRRDTFDLVHLDSLDLYGWMSELPRVPVTCTHHSIESQLLRRHAPLVESRLLGWYLARQAKLVERVERALCPRFSANLMMSETDAEELRALAPGSRTTVVPNGVDTTYFAPQPDRSATPGRVVFVGATDTFPNRDALEYLLGSIWPLIRSARPEASLCLIGRGTDALARHGAVPGVTALGYVADVRPHLAQACCCVVPLRVGGGTRLKILDAWAMGKTVVSTSVGCEGLDIVDGRNILVRDDPETFATAVIEVLNIPGLRARLGSNARETVERTYSWDVVGHGLRAAYRELLSPTAPQCADRVTSRASVPAPSAEPG